jgi:hypothetical protein
MYRKMHCLEEHYTSDINHAPGVINYLLGFTNSYIEKYRKMHLCFPKDILVAQVCDLIEQ